MAARITFDRVREFILDRDISDNPIDEVPTYFSDDEIRCAMDNIAAYFNEMPPHNMRTCVNNNTLPYKMYFLYGIVWQLYLSKLNQMIKDDMGYKAGGMDVDFMGVRIKHYKELIKLYKEEFVVGADRDKVANNYAAAMGPVG